jgi:two-component system NtrC family sensor kinase
VGQLAAGIAHEINNPLGVILAFAQSILKHASAGDTVEVPVKSIEREALRCRKLVQELLTFSRVSKVERESVDLNRVVESALMLISAKARMTQVEIRKDLFATLPPLWGNSNQIQGIVINLANNALDAIGEHSGALTFKTESVQEGPVSWVCLKVMDTGPGIPSEIQSRIFEPFFTTKPVGQGTGLGLALVHEIVERHAGRMEVQSRPGYTEFCVKFPATDASRANGDPLRDVRAA